MAETDQKARLPKVRVGIRSDRLACLVGWTLLSATSSLAEPSEANDATDHCANVVDARLLEMLPGDAAAYASRYRDCLHWSGEPAYNEERAHEIAGRVEENCTGLDSIRDYLHMKYPQRSTVGVTLRRVIADMDSFSENFAWYDPHHKSAALNRCYEASARRIGKRVDAMIAERHAQWDTAGAATRSMLEYTSKVLTESLSLLTENIDRLHPNTAAELRASCVRWEQETGKRIQLK